MTCPLPTANTIDGFARHADGSVTALPGGHLLAVQGSPFTGQGLGQIGAGFSPARPAELCVSNAHNGAGLTGLPPGSWSAPRGGPGPPR